VKRILTTIGVTALGALLLVPFAAASGGTPPSFSASTLSAPINDYGTTLLAGIAVLIGVVLVVKAPFALVRLAMRAINKVFGNSKPAAA
jgi:hypothetical protein